MTKPQIASSSDIKPIYIPYYIYIPIIFSPGNLVLHNCLVVTYTYVQKRCCDVIDQDQVP